MYNPLPDTCAGDMTIAEARDLMVEAINGKGQKCLLCGSFGKIYSRRLHATMGIALICAYKFYGVERWFHIGDITKEIRREALKITVTGDWAKLRYWGLIDEQPNTDATKRASGRWKLTPLAAGFVRGGVRLSSHVILYNDEALGFKGSHVTIERVLGKKYNYQEIMRSI